MAAEPRRVRVPPESELAKLLRESGERLIILEAGERLYLLRRVDAESEDLWADYDPEMVREAVRTYAGSWADRDADAMIERLYRAREEGSRPANRP